VRQNLYATCFASESVGLAVGDLGRIFHTTDGAKTWEIQTVGTKMPFVAAACIDEKTAFIAGQAGQIAQTTDAGASWTLLKSGVERQLLDIAFVDGRTGIAVGDYGTILRTEDGGVTWSKVAVPADTQLPEEYFGIVDPGDIVIYSVAWGSPNTVTVVGEFGVILRSNDGGRSFQSQVSASDKTLFGVFFADDQRGWAVGMESTMITTTDGGVTWAPQQVKSPPGFSLALYDLEILGNVGWAVGNSGFLLTSTDAGLTWNLVDVPPQLGSYWFREVALLPGGKGFIVGSTGMVLTINGTTFTRNKDQI
jgi:photosystem II stability/assembly factor-like uncharacterized protein